MTWTAQATDDFNRADASTLGANWTKLTSFYDLIISGNLCAPGNVAGRTFMDYYSARSWNANHQSTAKPYVGNNGASMYITVRAVTADRCYTLLLNGNVWWVYRTASYTSWTMLGGNGATQNYYGGDYISHRCVGNTLTGHLNGGSAVITRTDSTYADGSPGLALYDTQNGANYLNDWEGAEDISDSGHPAMSRMRGIPGVRLGSRRSW